LSCKVVSTYELYFSGVPLLKASVIEGTPYELANAEHDLCGYKLLY
jgi:hypothetical protein